MECKQSQNYFAQPCSVWFPDFEEAMTQMERRCRKYPVPFDAMITMLRYFRREITRQEFLSRFFTREAPEELLPSDRRKHLRAKKICTAYQNNGISGTVFDEQLLQCFRDRPEDDVFMPAFESWDEIKRLISRLEKKSKRLPIYFDGLGWSGYLKGIVTRRQYVRMHLAWDTGGYLAQLLAYGVDKEALKETYPMEISVCLRLRKLCIDYTDDLLSSDDFESQFLQLAREFCADIPE